MIKLRAFKHNEEGAVTVETSLVLTLVILCTGGVLECGLAFWQWNSAQQAARHGARLASVSPPLSQDLMTMTGLGNGVEAGDPFPDYEVICSGGTQSCNQGNFDTLALENLVFGPDGDGVCEKTALLRRGICDVVPFVKVENIDVVYQNSGFGFAGLPSDPAPLITVTVKDLEFNLIFLDIFFPNQFLKIPPVSVSVMHEDLRNQA